MSTLERAIALAAEASAYQTDKAGEPVILHVMRVVLGVRGDKERIVAALHDVAEDGPEEWSFSLRHDKWPADIVDAVEAITHRRGEPYRDYIARVAVNPLARVVKMADLRDNMNIGRLPTEQWDTHATKARMHKYAKAFAALQAV